MGKAGLIGVALFVIVIVGGALYYMRAGYSGVGTTTTSAAGSSSASATTSTASATFSSSSSTSTTSSSSLSPAEVDAIKYMAEEEKLALDVYSYLASKYPSVPVFANIVKSEETHVKAVLSLAERYGINVTLGPPGKFSNPHLQDLYNKLVAEGSKGLEQALKVGALVEETDIKDLQEWLTKVQHNDIKQVFECLMMGSRNHLRAFTSTLKKLYGITYEPQILPKQEYEQIINSPMETGSNSACASIGINIGANTTQTTRTKGKH